MSYLDGSTVDGGFLNHDMHDFNNTQATIAKWQEFGTEDKDGKALIPERPFLSRAFLVNKTKYKKLMKEDIKKIMAGTYTTSKMMSRLGRLVRKMIKNQIRVTKSPINKPKTISMKGFNDPLIHTKRMLHGVKFRKNIKRGRRP